MLYGLISPSMQVAAWRRDNLKGGIAQEDVLGDIRHHCTSLVRASPLALTHALE